MGSVFLLRDSEVVKWSREKASWSLVLANLGPFFVLLYFSLVCPPRSCDTGNGSKEQTQFHPDDTWLISWVNKKEEKWLIVDYFSRPIKVFRIPTGSEADLCWIMDIAYALDFRIKEIKREKRSADKMIRGMK